MEALMQTYDFPEIMEGNTCKRITFKLPEAEIFNIAQAKIYMQVRRKPDQLVVAEFSTVNEKLIKLSDYWFQFSAQLIGIPAGIYSYDILFVFPDGRRRTYIGGKWTIKSATTKKSA